jgi:hypothetical protein
MILTKSKLIQIIQEEMHDILSEQKEGDPGIKVGDFVSWPDKDPQPDHPSYKGRVVAIGKQWGGMTDIHVLWPPEACEHFSPDCRKGTGIHPAGVLRLEKSR